MVADGQTIDVKASVVVNATGVWSDDVRALDEGTHPSSIRPAKGVHITVPWSLVQNQIAVVIPVPKDRRSVFVVPWGGEGGDHKFTYIGTTDTDYDGPVDDPQITPVDVAYLLSAINAAVTTTITESDILGTWAGLRPLVRAATSERTADLSRRHSVRTSESGVVTVTGGKLTTYRRMAADAVDAATQGLGIKGRRSRTRRVRLHGAAGWDAPELPTELATRYGGDARAVLALCGSDPALAEPIVPGLPYTKAEVVYAARSEMARTVDDVLARRTRARLLARDASAQAAAEVAELMAAELGWSDAERDAQVASYRALIDAERSTGGLPETALDACSRNRRRSLPPDADQPRRAHAAHRLRGRCRACARPDRERAGGGLGRAARANRGNGRRGVRSPPAEIGEASRDWWPLAMIWALDDHVAARASVIVRAALGRGGRRGAAAVQRGPGSRDRRGRPQRRVRRERAGVRWRAPRPHRARWDRLRRQDVDARRRSPGNLRRRVRRRAPREPRRDLRALAPVDGALDRRRVARVPRRGSALDALREDRRHRRPASTSCSPTARS